MQEQQFWCALRGERYLPFPQSITLQVSRGWCESHTSRQSLFPPVMKKSSQAARLITAHNSDWKSAEQPASYHSVISGICLQKVLRQHCWSPASRATCLPFSFWGLFKPICCTGLVLSTAAIFSAQRWDAEPMNWLFPFTSAWKDDHKGFYQIARFLKRCLDKPILPLFHLMLFLKAAGGKYWLFQHWVNPCDVVFSTHKT